MSAIDNTTVLQKTFEIVRNHPRVTAAVAATTVGALTGYVSPLAISEAVQTTWGYLSGNIAEEAAEIAASYRGVWTSLNWATGSLAKAELAANSAAKATMMVRTAAGIAAVYLGRKELKLALTELVDFISSPVLYVAGIFHRDS